MLAIAQIFIKYLPTLIEASKSVPDVITFISGVHSIFKRQKIWTDEQEAAFDQSVADLKDDPAWKPEDAQKPA